jgi:hypothetical protein
LGVIRVGVVGGDAAGSGRDDTHGEAAGVVFSDEGYEFPGGYPTPETVRRVYDELDLNRAVQTYRQFFPTVSGLAIFKGNEVSGVVANRVFGTLETEPKHKGLTLNSDTP